METITDPAVIRACDEPDERGDFPCCADRAHKESLGGDSESGTYNRSNRPPAGPCADERTAPAPSSGAGLDLDALHETICDKFTGMAEVRQAADLLVAEVRRLTAEAATQREWFEAADAAAERRLDQSIAWMERAEAAEAEVVTLRARLAEGRRIVGMLAETVESECENERDICHEHDRTSDGSCALLADLLRARAALATTGEGQ